MDSLRDTLAAAMKGEDAPEPAINTEAVIPEPAAETAAPGAAETATIEAEKPPGAPERDEGGRFKPKQASAEGETPEAPKTETAPPAAAEPQTSEAIRVPPSLPAAVKAKFGSLDPDVQAAFVKQEETVQTAKAEWGRKGERLNRFEEILGPHADKWMTNGLDVFQGVQTLLAAQNILERDPVGGLVHIARSYGVNPAQIAQALGLPQTSAAPGGEGGQGQAVPADFSRALQPVLQQVQTLQQQLQARNQAEEAAGLSQAQAQVEAFKSDPANLYFENVRDDVADRIAAGKATTLADAYEQAIWADPTIRPLLLDSQVKAAASASAEQARKAAEEKAKADRAKAANHAGGSVTGSPGPGAQAPQAPRASLREELEAARASVSATL